MKKKIMAVVLLVLVLVLIWLADEGSEPLVLKGTDLNQEAGYSDSEGMITISTYYQYYGLFATTDDYALLAGTYTLRPYYSATSAANIIEVWDNGTKIAQWNLENTGGEKVTTDYTFTLDKDSQELHVRIYYQGEGDLYLYTLTIDPEEAFYYDGVFLSVLAVLLFLAALVLERVLKDHPLSRETSVTLLALTGLCLYSSLPMFTQSFVQSDDICYHLMRIEGIKDGILDGQFPVIIYPEALSGNGFLNAMYPYLFLYIPALLRLCGVSLVLSYRFLILLANIATTAITWKSLRSITSSRYACFLGTALYVLLPYRFTNIYARGALGETLALTFLPLIIAGFYHVLVGEKKNWYYLVIGFTGVIESHILSTAFMFGIFAVCCVIFIRDLFQDKRWLALLKAAVLTVLLNLWFAAPFAYFYKNENLYLQSLEWSGYAEYSINLSSLVDTFHSNGYRFLSLGLPVMLLAGAGLCWLLLERREAPAQQKLENRFLVFLYVTACVLTFFVTGYFGSMKLQEKLPFLSKLFSTIQFPWRLLAPASILFIFAGSIWLSRSKVLGPYRKQILFLLVGINLLTVINAPYNDNNFAYQNYDDTTTVGHEDKIIAVPKSDATIIYPYEWRVDAVLDDEMTADLQLSDEERVTVIDYEKDGTSITFTYQTDSSGEYVDFPLQKYLGYVAEDEDGNELEITYGNHYRVRVWLEEGEEHTIRIYYRQHIGFRISQAISLLTLLGCIAWWLMGKRKAKRPMTASVQAEVGQTS